MNPFEEVLMQYDRYIHYLIHKYKLYYDAEDAYQQLSIDLYLLTLKYDDTKDFDQYIKYQLNFKAIDYTRKTVKYYERHILSDEHIEISKEDDDSLWLIDAHHLLNEYEYTWLNYALQGLSVQQMSQLMNKSESSIKGYRQNARLKLKPL